MKNKLLRYLTCALLAVVFLTASCKKWIDPAMNIDPDNARSVYSALILPEAEANLAFVYQGFDYVGVTGMWLQYFEGLDRQAYGMYNYSFTSDDVDNLYSALYAGVMMDCQQIIDQTSVAGKTSPHLRGMAEVIKANALGTAAGLWGSVPYSTAFKGNDQLKPTFDSEQNIYAAIQTLLNSAITDLSVPAATIDYEEKYISAAAQDLIYGGSLTNWKKAAFSLKARYEIRLSRIAGFVPDTVLVHLSKGISSTAGDFQFNFLGNEDFITDNPLFEFSIDRYFYAGVNSNFIDLLNGNSDPRIDAFLDKDGNDCPLGPYGYADGIAYLGGHALGDPWSPSLLISNFEALFIKAECLFMKTDLAGAATAYNAAVAASLDKWGVTDAAWLATNAAESAATITLSKIMNGKYIAMYAQGEAWADYRRYQGAYPVLTPPVNNATSGVQPGSYPYPTNEKVSNGANVPARGGLTAKLWAFQ